MCQWQTYTHPLALALRRVRITPGGREVRSEGEDALTLVLVDSEAIGRAPALVVLLGRAQGTQLGVPVGLERVGDESIRGSTCM